jgi:NADP-dependent 3-hydroxy acid dehydrogenase YdfG
MTLAGKYSLAGKSAVVTGAGNGIGRAIALAFAEAGANVACVDLDRAAAEKTAAAIGKAAIAVVCDVSDEAQVEAAAKTILGKYPAVHILLKRRWAAPRGLLRQQGRADPARQGDGDRPCRAEYPGEHIVARRGRD